MASELAKQASPTSAITRSRPFRILSYSLFFLAFFWRLILALVFPSGRALSPPPSSDDSRFAIFDALAAKSIKRPALSLVLVCGKARNGEGFRKVSDSGSCGLTVVLVVEIILLVPASDMEAHIAEYAISSGDLPSGDE